MIFSKLSSFTALVSFVLASVLGLFIVPQLAVQIKPSYVQPILHVGCTWHGANAEAIERQITSVLEGNLNGLRGITSIESNTYNKGCRISIQFTEKTDIYKARYEAAAIIRNIYKSLPEQASYPSINIRGESTDKRPFMTYSLLSHLPHDEIIAMGNNELLPKLNELNGVHSANLSGAQKKEWHLYFDRGKLSIYGLTLEELQQAALSNETKIGLGEISHQNAEQFVVLTSQASEGWESMSISNTEGRIIQLGDIAKVRLENRVPQRFYRINGVNAISLIIVPEVGANQMKLAKKIRKIIENYEEKWNFQLHFILKKDDSQYIEDEVKKIILRSSVTLFILFVFVWLISRNGRYLFIIAISIVANLSIAFLVYYFFDIELHLYSFAGITVSFGIIIDNTIVMVDHIRYKNNQKVFLALLASTLTTISSLCVIFFLSERLILNMLDFALVIIINLSISLIIALLLVPALMIKLPLPQTHLGQIKKRKRILWLSVKYEAILWFLNRYKVVYILLLILCFGLPVSQLPTSIGSYSQEQEELIWEGIYNKTIGSKFYNSTLRTPINYAFGGCLRLFTDKVNQSKYFQKKEQTNLTVRASMPVGATIHQMNEAFQTLEQYLLQFKEIERFETFIYSPENARMIITFKEIYEHSSFPFLLEDLLISKAIDVGSADWIVKGQGDVFSNSIREQTGFYRVKLNGYNYQQLYGYAEEIKSKLLMNPRIQEVNIMGRNARFRDKTYSYVLTEEGNKIAANGGHFYNIYEGLQQFSMHRKKIGNVSMLGKRHDMVMSSADAEDFDMWNLNQTPLKTSLTIHKLGNLSKIEKEKVPNEISRIDQQYYLMLEYDFIGDYQLGHNHLKHTLEVFSAKMPVGYKVKQESNGLRKEEKKEQVSLIFLVIFIIYFVCAILFESLLQPLAVVAMIPLTFIGVFLAFYLLELNFDQGGFASFVLLSGLTVNAALFIINDMNNLRGRYLTIDEGLKMKTYLKAFHLKIIPILLAVMSTIVGLSPYLYLGQNETFWFPLAVGTIGGLLFSLFAIFFCLPLFFTKKILTN